MEPFPSYLKNQSKTEINELYQDRINLKLSLRKKKLNEILIKKRIFSNIEDTSWTHELFLSNLNLPPNYKIIFAKDEELISTALKSIKSENIFDIKYGICLLKQYTSYFQDGKILNDNLNLNFISDILNLLEKWGEKKEKQIVFNLLYLLTNYSYINTNKTISKFFLSSKGYKIWEICFNLQDYEIMSQLIWILDNITNDDDEICYNLLKSNFFQNKIYNFFSSPTIICHLNNNNPKNIFYIIIERGIGLLSNLLASKINEKNKEEKYRLCKPIFELILKYSDSNSENIFCSCVYSLSIAIDYDERLIDLIDNSNIINDILNKKFFNVEKIIFYCNRILGDYIFKKSNLSKDFYDKCTFYEMDIFFGVKSDKIIIEVLLVLSNIMFENKNSADIICCNKALIDKIINLYKIWTNDLFIKETLNFFIVLLQIVNINNFIEIENKGLIEISFEHAKNSLNEKKEIIYFFELIELVLDNGDIIKENFGGRNLIKEKCDNYGLIDLLRKYENCNEKELEEKIQNIISKYYEDNI